MHDALPQQEVQALQRLLRHASDHRQAAALQHQARSTQADCSTAAAAAAAASRAVCSRAGKRAQEAGDGRVMGGKCKQRGKVARDYSSWQSDVASGTLHHIHTQLPIFARLSGIMFLTSNFRPKGRLDE